MLNKPLFPATPWTIVENKFDSKQNTINETIFALGNGFIGMRGTFEEGYHGNPEETIDGIYLNGFYETDIIKYPECAFGYAKTNQTMLNVTNSRLIQLYVDGELFHMLANNIESYERKLDMQKGMTRRELVWQNSNGKKVKLEITRLVSFTRQHLAAIQYKVTPLNFSGEITIISGLNGEVRNVPADDDPRKALGAASQGQVLQLAAKESHNTAAVITQTTTNSNFSLACAMENDLQPKATHVTEEPLQQVLHKFTISATQNQSIILNKYIAYTVSNTTSNNIAESTLKVVTEAKQVGFDNLLKEQEAYLNDYWHYADIEIDGDSALQQGIRFNLYHLLQSVGKDGKTNIASKGITGEGYGGHYFWDTESYVFPAFLYAKPEICRKLLEYRYSILPQSRNHAREIGHEIGALYSWRTINGDECSPFFPAGSAQYHINADIIYALKTYTEVTNDIDFMREKGAEMLFETARLWNDLGHYSPRNNHKFCIDCVTGPDEYTALVNNNFYTNAMAQMHLQYACDIAKLLQNNYPDDYNNIAAKIGLDENELESWKNAANNMYLPYNEELGIHEQDDSFLNKPLWPLNSIPRDKHPLLMHYHYLKIYRHQINKQADTLLAMFLLGNKFSFDDKKRDYDYYEQLTTHDSSLSMCTFSIMASELGYADKAYNYFAQTARLDLENGQGNTSDGIHAANMAGTWMGIVNGFAGMRMHDGKLSFNPHLPKQWSSYQFKIRFRSNVLMVSVNSDTVNYTLVEGDSLSFKHCNDAVTLSLNATKTFTHS